jgi:hypothetical protein
MKKLVLILNILTLTLSGCEKNSGFALEIYLLNGYKTKPNSHEIISGSEILSKNPIISYNDVISYDSAQHYFVIDSLKAKKLMETNWPVSGTPFALTIDRQVIYSGFFIPGYSSSGSNWYSIDPLTLGGKLRVTLGYPGDQFGFTSSDLRNDARIINLLTQDRKLN